MTRVTVLDVTSYILRRTGPITVMKLQKLVYYAQAWSLVWDERLLFREKIEAWAHGPVAPRLYDAHRGQFRVSRISGGDCRHLNPTQRETVDAVVKYYGKKTALQLSELTHREDPWREARAKAGLRPLERGHAEITRESMMEYYSSLV